LHNIQFLVIICFQTRQYDASVYERLQIKMKNFFCNFHFYL